MIYDMKREGFFEHKCSYCDRLWSTYELLTTMSQKMVIRMLGNFKSESEVAKKLWIYSERFAVFIHFWTVWKRRTLLHPKKGTNSHKNEGSYCEEFILPRVEYKRYFTSDFQYTNRIAHSVVEWEYREEREKERGHFDCQKGMKWWLIISNWNIWQVTKELMRQWQNLPHTKNEDDQTFIRAVIIIRLEPSNSSTNHRPLFWSCDLIIDQSKSQSMTI